MKNNFITKIIGATLAFAMMIGGAVGINAAKQAKEAYADTGNRYERISSAESLSAGDYIVFVNQDETYACGTTQNTNNRTPVVVTTSNHSFVKAANDNIQEFKLIAGATNGQYGLHAGSGYYKSNSSSKNNTTTDDTAESTAPTGTQLWTFAASNNVFTVGNVSNSNYYLAFNGTSYFSQYKTGQSKPYIYKKVASISVTGVSVSPTSVTLGVGGTQQLTPTVAPNDATNKNVSYSSGNTNVATVTAGGLITAVAAGNTTITVTTEDGDFTTTCTVNVTAPISVTGVSLNKDSTSIEVGETETLTATISPANASNQSVTWSSDDEDVATVDGGVVTAVATGTATITATTVDGGYSASCEVTVTAPSSISFVSSSNAPGGSSITVGGVTMSCTNCKLDDTAGYRFYSGSTLTFTSTIGNMCSIEFTGSDGSNKISNISSSVNTGTVTTNSSTNTASWTGNANSVSFTMSAQGRANQIVVTMTPTAQTVTLDKELINLKTNETNGKQVTATAYNVENPNFIWTPASGNKVTVEVDSTEGNSQTVTIKPNTLVAVETSVTLTIENTSLSATIQVNITEPAPGETAGTAYTVAQAKAAIEAADADIQNVYIKGKVSQVDEVSLSNHNATYWISDDGTTTGHFKIFRGKYVDNADFTSDDQIMVGDVVIVYGTISNQYENLNQGNYIVSITPIPRINSIVLTPDEVTIEPESTGEIVDLFTNITINQDDGSNKTINDIAWTSDDSDVFAIIDDQYIAGDTHRTSTTIHASIGGREYASATINVINSNIHYVPYSIPAEWTLVDDISTLTAGDRVILTGVKADVAYAAGTYSGTGNNVPADTENTLTVSGNKVTGVVDTMIYTLENGSVDGSFAFKDSAGKYLYAAGASSSNYMKSQNEINNNASFILNSDGTVVAQGTGSRNHMMYNNYQSSNLFSCYESTFSNGELITFYKLIGGNSGFVDLYSAKSTATLHGTESNEGGNLSVSDVFIRFGAELSISEWEAIEAIGNVTDYGVKLFSTRKSITSETPVQDAIDAGKTPLTISKGSGAVPSDPENGKYSFTVTVNLTSESNYGLVFCAAPFIEVDGTVYFLEEVQFSVNTLAQHYIDNSLPSELSSDALELLA